MGVPGFRIFHGQEATPFNLEQGAWRVNGNEGAQPYTERQGWDCPEDDGGYWYVGFPDDSVEGFYLAMQRWGELLWNQGYVSAAGLRLIVEPPSGSSETEIDARNPGYVVRPPAGYTTAAGNNNPYSLNFLINDGIYTFITAPHPPPPQKK